MRVNSAFKALFTNRLAMGCCASILGLAIFFLSSSFTGHSDRDLKVKEVNLIIRQIGHLLLLQAGDSTSRVLPVKEVKDGVFLLEFEKEFVFSHDSLMVLAQALLPKAQFPSGYTVTVHECITASIVYGFQINKSLPDIKACRGRRQPPGCYTIEIAFPDFYGNVEQKKDAIAWQTGERLNDDGQEARFIPEKNEESRTISNDYDIDRLTEELKSFQVGSRDSDPIPMAIRTEELKTSTFDYPLSGLVYSGVLVLLSITLLIGRFGKISLPSPVQNQNQVATKEVVPEMAALGSFLFDVKGQRLLSGNEMISLTDKECRILELLNENFGELIPRETLMQKVWINEGVITGRSLDMFVSKLRKKLSSDPDLRITNVHGKGYKLEIPGIKI